jgi:branched-chain amino acid aminotransferase
MCTANKKPFHLADHWKGLVKSARDLRLKIPITQKEYEQIIAKLIKKSPYTNTSIRTVLTGGISENGITLPDTPTFFILLHDMDQFTPQESIYRKGGKLITDTFLRAHATSKTTSYVEAIKNQKKKNAAKAIELLYIHNGLALECATSNIFAIFNGILTTPKNNVFHGVTRKTILTLAKQNTIPVIEREIRIEELLSADEIFITGSAKHILPITKIDTTIIGNGKPGICTKNLMALYRAYRDNY